MLIYTNFAESRVVRIELFGSSHPSSFLSRTRLYKLRLRTIGWPKAKGNLVPHLSSQYNNGLKCVEIMSEMLQKSLPR